MQLFEVCSWQLLKRVASSRGSHDIPVLCLPTAYCLLPTAYFLLLTSYCLLPTSYCLLPTSYCLLPTAYCSPIFMKTFLISRVLTAIPLIIVVTFITMAL